jgi:hypothetical protein
MAALNGEFDSLSREKRLAAAFRQLGLSPAGELAVFRILGNDPFPSAAGESPFHLSVRRVLEREAARPAAGPPQYEMALRNLDLYEGKYAQAIARSRKILAGRGEDELPGNRFLLALLLKVTGEPAPLAGWLQRCSANEAPTPETVGRPRGATCRDTAFWVSWRCVKLLERKAPRAFGDVFVEFARAEPANWPMRCETIRLLRYVDPARCAKESERLLATPAGEAPIGARLDAMTELVNVAADRKDHATALAGCDRYLSLLQFRSPAAPPDLWGKLAALPGDETDAGTPWTWDESPSDVTWMLAKKVKIALDARDGPAARRFLVDYLSTVFQLLEEANSYCSLFDPSKAPPEERAALEIYIASTSRELAGLYRREARLGRGYLERIAALENDLAQSLRNQ